MDLGTWLYFPSDLALRFHPELPGSLGSCRQFSCSSDHGILTAVSCSCSSYLGSLLKRVYKVIGGTDSPLQAMSQ